MNRLFLSIIFLSLWHILSLNICSANDDYRSLSPILDSAEHFFISIKNSEFGDAWDILSESSRSTIVSDVYKASSKINNYLKKEDILGDFNRRGTIFTNYWLSFRRSFNAGMILEDSQWEMGPVTKESAEIIITYKGAYRPTILKMRKEHKLWKVGLVETFWQRKAVKLLPMLFP